MVNEISLTLAAVLLALVVVYALLVANQIRPDCPRHIRHAWMALASCAAWLMGPLLIASWRDCLGWAVAGFVSAVLWALIAERRGHKHVPWEKVLP